MLEIVFFRLTLVLLMALALCIGGMWAVTWHREMQARDAVAHAFDEYNRYLDACGDSKAGVV